MRFSRLWAALIIVIVGSFVVLGYYGSEIYQQAPPLPARVVTEDGRTLFTREDILDGQNVWQSMGGQQVGSIWGHGGYVAPDWSADWLHRESTALLERRSRAEHGAAYAELDAGQQAAMRQRLQDELRENTYADGVIRISSDRAAVFDEVASHYTALFGDDPALASLREAYAIPAGSVPDAERRQMLAAFFWWTSWASITERPGSELTYTHNWPPDPLVGNTITAEIVVWSVLSFVLLLAGIGALAWYFATHRDEHAEQPDTLPDADPLLGLAATPSMKATLKYFWVAAILLVVQVLLGAVTAHYGVEGSEFYGIPLAEVLPYSVTRSWHLQIGIYWIATAWLGTGLYVAPAVSGHEPRFQKLGVNLLFVCLVVIVAGSLFGTWYGTRQQMGFEANFWFGHSGWEYIELGRFWQIFLFIGLFLWLGLLVRAIYPVFRLPGDHRPLLALFVLASAAIALFYGAGLMYGQRTHLAVAEYWRWWVVHLWVEAFFEVFATVVIAFLFTRMGLLRTATATAAVLFATIIFLAGGILGTFHHLYFSGTPTAVLAIGAVFSALEVVPLTLIGFEAYQNYRLSRMRPWVDAYKWPIYFFVAVAFWNLVGAGIFGFLINPPVALYYMQGLNTTPVHGHTALFGVYGMLGIGLILFCLRSLTSHRKWRTKTLAFSFWCINIGLALMVLISVLPVGLLQAWASVKVGMWYARSAELLQTPLMDTLRWLRVVGDTIFAIGVLALGWFLVGVRTGRMVRKERNEVGQHPQTGPLPA